MSNNVKLDFQVVHDKFESSLLEDNDTVLKAYIEGYEELCKFFTLMGTIFSFVTNDLVSKMEILNELLKQNPIDFETVKKMIHFEKKNELLTKKNYVSGSRTLLRLHRGLNFIREFLRGVSTISEKDGTAYVCKEAYNNTLAPHHPFLIRNGAKLAMNAMPTREQLLKKITGDDPKEIEIVLILMPRVLTVLDNVFENIEQVYTINDLHGLP